MWLKVFLSYFKIFSGREKLSRIILKIVVCVCECVYLCVSVWGVCGGVSICVCMHVCVYMCLLGAGVKHSAHDKGHEEGGSTYAKEGSSLRSPPGNPRVSTPITRACLLYYFVLSPTPLTLRGAVPHHLFRRRS